MLNRWIKPNEDLDIIISRHVMKNMNYSHGLQKLLCIHL
ncbi:hypothetical protein ELT1_46 [Escherichia phage ELT1]|nr:hypothetical protein ELT1_46 [Escherichia phage ELT1]